jgi:hypothetical protein
MAEVVLRHEIFCTEEDYWAKCVWTREFNEGLYLKTLGFPRYEVQADTENGTTRSRKTLIEPPVAGLPAPLKKAMGDTLSYVEEATFDKTKRVYAFKVVPSVFADKTKVWGNLYCENWNGKSFTRVSKINVEVKVFGIGGMVESRIMEDLKRSYDVGEKWTNDFAKAGGFGTK